MKRILIADDDKNIRDAIKTFLENEGFIVSAFNNGDNLLREFKENPCDLIILDVMMPGHSGFDICTEIREISTVPIIFLTARDSDMDYATGLSLGSDDYFTKPFSAISLVMRIKAIFRRIEYEKQNYKQDSGEIIKLGNIILDANRITVKVNDDNIKLTPNEFALLHYLLKNNDRAISRDELLENIWGFNTEVETRAADDTIRRIRKKLINSDVEIASVWGFGFKLKIRGNDD